MPREFRGYPDAEVETPVGTVRVVFQGQHRVHIHGESLHLNAVPYNVRADVTRTDDAWALHGDTPYEQYQRLSGTRENWLGMSYDKAQLTPAARKKFVDVVIPAVADFIETQVGTLLLLEGEEVFWHEEARHAEREVAELSEQLSKANSKLHAAEVALTMSRVRRSDLADAIREEDELAHHEDEVNA